MSFDRVLPNPAVLQHESLRTTNPLDHKIMNDGAMVHRTGNRPNATDAACQYAELRNGKTLSNQKPPFGRPKGPVGKSKPLLIPHGLKPTGPILDPEDLAKRDQSSMSSGTACPMVSSLKDNTEQFCLCRPGPKIPRPRNGESRLSAPSTREHSKCFLFHFIDSGKQELLCQSRYNGNA